MANEIHADGSVLGHRFERAGYTAPFRFVGMEEKKISYPDGTTQAAGTCQYCGTGIRYCFWIQDGAGRKFYVGSDCVRHLDDEKLVAVVMSAERRRKNDLARERRRVKELAAAKVRAAEVAERMPEYVAALAALEARPHPNSYFAGQGKTAADYFRYFERDGVPELYKLNEAVRAAAALSTAQA